MPALIPEWKSSWKFTSVQAGLVLGFIDSLYAANFFGLQDTIGARWFGLLNAAVTALVIPFLRNIQQHPAVPPEVKAEMKAHIEAVPTVVKPQPQTVRTYIDSRIIPLEREIKVLTKLIAERFPPPKEPS